ncbi:hypothetical protein Tco_0188890 [Tanacetum coccineum]
MDHIDKINTSTVEENTTLLKALNKVFETLEADSALKAHYKRWLKPPTPPLSSLNAFSTQCASISESLKEDHAFNQRLLKVTMHAGISSIKGMVTEMFQVFKSFSTTTPLAPPKPDRGKGIARDTDEPPRKLMPASKEVHQDLNGPIHIPYEIHGKMFHLTEDELRDIIPKKRNKVVEDLMNSLSKKYERLGVLPSELGIHPALPVLTQAPSQISGRKRKIQELEPEVQIHGLECNRSLPKGVPFSNNLVIEHLENGLFFKDVFGDEAFQRMSDMHKNTLAEYMILSGADIRPPMLDKDLYDSWKIEENGVIRTKKYVELSAAEKIQVDCDMKATNIILQGLPADIYSLMKMEQFQVNTKFLNSLPPEWSKFVTDVKLVKDLHTSNIDQLHAYLEQHELHANEVRIMRERNQDPLVFVANQQMTQPHFNLYQSSYNNPQLQQQFSQSQYGLIQPNQQYSSHYPSQTQFNHLSIPPSHTYQSQMNHQTSIVSQVAYQSPQAPTQLMTESPIVDLGFDVPVFSLRDDLIACINKAMAFLTAIASLRFPTTNNQLKTSSNPRNQATIQDGRVTVQQVQGRQGQNYSGTTYKGNATSSRGNTTSGQARVVKCYNCQEAQEAGQILNEEQLAFLADPGIQASQARTVIPHNAAFQTEDLDTYDSDCDGLSTTQAVLMANISNYGSDVISEVPNSETYLNDMDNQSVHALQDFEQTPVIDFTDNEISSDSNIIPYS